MSEDVLSRHAALLTILADKALWPTDNSTFAYALHQAAWDFACEVRTERIQGQEYNRRIAELALDVLNLLARVAELEVLLPQDNEDTWYCPKCHTPSSTDDLECVCGYERPE